MSNTSFDKIIDKVFDGFKKITPALVALAIATGLIVFLPDEILDKMGLLNMPEITTTITGVLFIVSCALILTILGSIVFQEIKKKIKIKLFFTRSRKKFINLCPTQKKIIIQLMNSPSKSMELYSLSGDTLYLSEYNFIYRPQQNIDAYSLCDNRYTYIPQPWLIDLFNKEPAIFDMDNVE